MPLWPNSMGDDKEAPCGYTFMSGKNADNKKEAPCGYTSMSEKHGQQKGKVRVR